MPVLDHARRRPHGRGLVRNPRPRHRRNRRPHPPSAKPSASTTSPRPSNAPARPTPQCASCTPRPEQTRTPLRTSVLFVCVRNAGRSRTAAAFSPTAPVTGSGPAPPASHPPIWSTRSLSRCCSRCNPKSVTVRVLPGCGGSVAAVAVVPGRCAAGEGGGVRAAGLPAPGVAAFFHRDRGDDQGGDRVGP